jgi:hypothetical protein
MRDFRLFLVSILIACLVWVMHTFALEYSATIPCTVRVTTSLTGYAPNATAAETVLLRGKATGFNILGLRKTGRKPVELDITVEPRHFKEVPDAEDTFTLPITELRERLGEQMGDHFSIDFIDAEQLTFTFEPQSFVKVPVVASVDLAFRPQYMQVGEVVLKPDSVLVYGAVKELQRITQVRTQPISFRNVDKTLQGYIGLEPVSGLRLELDRVWYEVEVDRYVETAMTLPVTVKGTPPGRTLIVLPSQVQLIFRAPFRPRGGRIVAEDLSLVVDYADFAGAESTKVIPRLVTDRDIYAWRLKPEMVECIQVERR